MMSKIERSKELLIPGDNTLTELFTQKILDKEGLKE